MTNKHDHGRRLLTALTLLTAIALSACATPKGATLSKGATPTPVAQSHSELIDLPPPRGRIPVSVYAFRDQTGQYKGGTEASTFSTAVTQGAGSMLVKALRDSSWFLPLEREGLQNLLTERKILRAAQQQQGQEEELRPLMHANILIEGGIIGYDSNVSTGGLGAKYFGVGGSTQYRVDQVTVMLRAVDTRSGQILHNISTTKTVLSREVRAGVFRFVRFKRLLEAEAGYTVNEPVQLAVADAIEEAVLGLIVEGVEQGLWALQNPTDIDHPTIAGYRADREAVYRGGSLVRNRLGL